MQGYGSFKGFQNLKSLDLRICVHHGCGIRELAVLSRLESLNLAGTDVTDAGLLELKNFSNLRSLQVDAPITDEGVAYAQKMMPSLEITFPDDSIPADKGRCQSV